MLREVVRFIDSSGCLDEPKVCYPGNRRIKNYTDEDILEQFRFNYQIMYAVGLRKLGERYLSERTIYDRVGKGFRGEILGGFSFSSLGVRPRNNSDNSLQFKKCRKNFLEG